MDIGGRSKSKPVPSISIFVYRIIRTDVDDIFDRMQHKSPTCVWLSCDLLTDEEKEDGGWVVAANASDIGQADGSRIHTKVSVRSCLAGVMIR